MTETNYRALEDGELAELYAAAEDEDGRARVLAECERRDRLSRQRAGRASLVEEWFLHAHAQYLAASAACNGRFLNRLGDQRGISEWSLWSGSASRVDLYASEELREYWGTFPRVTVTEYIAQVHASRRAEREAGMYRNCVHCGWDFGHLIMRDHCGSPTGCAERQRRGDPDYGRPHRLRKDKVSA